jgi:hypothetical protein
MAWKLHFDGREIAAIDNESHDRIVNQLTLAGQTDQVAWIEIHVGSSHYKLFWTPGAAIYFEEFDEAADESAKPTPKQTIRRIR